MIDKKKLTEYLGIGLILVLIMLIAPMFPAVLNSAAPMIAVGDFLGNLPTQSQEILFYAFTFIVGMMLFFGVLYKK